MQTTDDRKCPRCGGTGKIYFQTDGGRGWDQCSECANVDQPSHVVGSSAWVGDDEALRTETERALKEWQADARKVWEYFNGDLDKEDMWRVGYVAGRLAQSAKSPTDPDQAPQWEENARALLTLSLGLVAELSGKCNHAIHREQHRLLLALEQEWAGSGHIDQAQVRGAGGQAINPILSDFPDLSWNATFDFIEDSVYFELFPEQKFVLT